MPAKDALKTPASQFAPSPLTNRPPRATPAFASAADALRAKIRACAARSFAAQHKTAGKTAASREDDGGGGKEKAVTALATGRGVRRAGQEGPRAHS